jgi:hypothetical protein
MAKPGGARYSGSRTPAGDRKTQGQGIDILHPNKGPAKVEPYQIGNKNAPDIEALKKQLTKQAPERNTATVTMGKSHVYKPNVYATKGPTGSRPLYPPTQTGQG